jgi:hypothetical protein
MKLKYILRYFLYLSFFFAPIMLFSQPQKAFFVVHCDPNEAYNFPELETFVDSANAYNVKLTIEFTSFWIDSILPYQSRRNKIVIWQSQGHEIGMHHHEVEAPSIWDGFSNLSMLQIDSAGRDTNKYIGNTDSLYNLIQRVSSIQLYTSGNELVSELPSQISYQTSGTKLSSAFSNATIVSNGSKSYCNISHAFLFADPHRLDSIMLTYPNATGYDVLGVVCHVYNFVALPQAAINYFKFLNDNQIASMTVSEIMQDECTASLGSDIRIQNSIEIFPNPCHDFVSIKYSGQYNLSYELFDLTGALLLAGYLVNSDTEIDVSSLKNGIYYLHVYNSDRAFHPVKLMKFK